ncbi:RES family NAD+ phosphorylase [Alteromonas sp. ASW11-19]|uniref:RES family NAD+ phosphorylase n=1 Tax=Alteromonas salexigens TaxID=2982530 RepID=A0ABT2VW57_9ALTE|nr:RES family NAD+ phosphorylase [Alteromonas salexigens]MCU7556079.1 RES family NAD+ phosphorylase [Alteromonas salexigens]
MVNASELPDLPVTDSTGYRLVNSKFPPIALFDDVADADEFEAVYACQTLTNPRLQNEVGNLNLLPAEEIPFGIDGVSYAVAPFTHVNPDGSRFSAGDFGVLYIADTAETAIEEVRHHQQEYWNNVEGLAYDRFVFRELCCQFQTSVYKDLPRTDTNAIYLDPDDYSHSQRLGLQLKQNNTGGLRYPSVRNEGRECFALFSPRTVTRVFQSKHYEMVYREGQLTVNQLVASPGR